MFNGKLLNYSRIAPKRVRNEFCCAGGKWSAAAYYRHQNGFATALHNAIFQILHSLKPIWIHSKIKGRDRSRVVILKLNFKEYIDGVLKSKVNFEFLVNLFVSENDRIH